MTKRLHLQPKVVSISAKKRWGFLAFLIGVMSFLLNHTMRLAGFNLSFADFFLVATVLVLVFSSRLYIPYYALLFFSLIVIVTVSTTLLVTPLLFNIQVDLKSVIGDLVKLLVSFLYFVTGINVARLGMQHIVLRWFAYGATFVAIIGMLMEVSGIQVFRDIFFYGDLRFRGFMSDPNFYAILACAAIAYFAFTPMRHVPLRWLAILLLSFSVILSASKTGLIALIILVALIIGTKVMKKKNLGPIMFLVLGTSALLLFLDRIRLFLSEIATRYSEQIPQLDRISVLISEDPSRALSGDGSTREASWRHGAELIQSSPVLGVGVGTYSDVTNAIFSTPVLAHNTYIQLAAEWGLPLTIFLFCWIIIVLLRTIFIQETDSVILQICILRSMIIVLLIGSVSLSLNNARMFWLFLGVLVFMVYKSSAGKVDLKTDISGVSRK